MCSLSQSHYLNPLVSFPALVFKPSPQWWKTFCHMIMISYALWWSPPQLLESPATPSGGHPLTLVAALTDTSLTNIVCLPGWNLPVTTCFVHFQSEYNWLCMREVCPLLDCNLDDQVLTPGECCPHCRCKLPWQPHSLIPPLLLLYVKCLVTT